MDDLQSVLFRGWTITHRGAIRPMLATYYVYTILCEKKVNSHSNDFFGRRCVFINDEQYGYNIRNELISADELSYAYDDIGNRTTAEGKTYTANNLNQYTAIDDFAPQYDDDGNQTKVLTETGEWAVEYNAENRPVRWTRGTKVITMAFDRMGRRVEIEKATKNVLKCILLLEKKCKCDSPIPEFSPIPLPQQLPEEEYKVKECSAWSWESINWGAVGMTVVFGASTVICAFCPLDGPVGEVTFAGLTSVAIGQIIEHPDKE